MPFSKILCGCVLSVGLIAVGCGSDPAPVASDEGMKAQSALASRDVRTTVCKDTSDTYSRSEPRVTARMRRSGSPVVLEPNTPPQQARGFAAKPWLTKAPILIRTGPNPVDVAVMETGGARVGLAWDDWSAQESPEAAYQRVRFAPCEGDPAEPTWYGWPGSIVADRKDVCLDLAIREAGGEISLERVSLGNGCPGERD